jgi:hypothetical protein
MVDGGWVEMFAIRYWDQVVRNRLSLAELADVVDVAWNL